MSETSKATRRMEEKSAIERLKREFLINYGNIDDVEVQVAAWLEEEENAKIGRTDNSSAAATV